jgi:hypothetical protein
MKNKRRETILWVEGVGFGLLVLFAWLTEIMHLPQVLFADSSNFNLGRALLRTAVILVVWIAVHLSTRRLLQRLHHLEEFLKVCSWCRKIGHEGEWMTMEDYFGSELATKTSHGICPDCSRSMTLPGGKTSPPIVTKLPPPHVD